MLNDAGIGDGAQQYPIITAAACITPLHLGELVGCIPEQPGFFAFQYGDAIMSEHVRHDITPVFLIKDIHQDIHRRIRRFPQVAFEIDASFIIDVEQVGAPQAAVLPVIDCRFLGAQEQNAAFDEIKF
ncbi:MAG: hypothetical protein HW386_2457 [Gammaproteobacteria bacterium]|nr:hypothetical protein [Gammaproteobacteria bacterium]